ncbi:MAG: M1 family metallopeptidase [Thermoleophilaceae bacterium]
MNRAPIALAAALTLLLCTAATAGAARYVAGSAGSGDPFFPLAGNGGYDARHYSLELDYDQPANLLEGQVEIRARATQNLHRFNLDLRDFYEVSRVEVDGKRARFDHEGQELSISPRPKLKRGDRFEVEVTYAGEPQPVVDPDHSIEGWIPTDDGAFVVNEPQGSPGWFPVNDSPRDKATYEFEITVPAGHTAMANGELISKRTRRGETTWRWRERDPMAPYLATATNGPFLTEFYEANGLAMYDAVDPDTRTSSTAEPNPALAFERLDPQPEIIGFFSDLYGRYPFTSGGGIMDWAPNVFYSLESQTRANYWRIVGPSTVVHEIAHQWFGNAVTLAVWPDIWLNEGFATWSEWIYDERHGAATAQETFDELYAAWGSDPDFDYLNRPPADVGGPEHLFAGTVYDRGAMTLQALREKVGDDAFFRILRAWYADNKYGNVTTADLIALSERISGQQLDDFFDVWLYEEGKPASW